jgi:hypothetical protein
MKILNIIERENSIQVAIHSYPILEESNEQSVIDSANQHFKQLIETRLNEQKEWDRDIYNIILDDTGLKNTDEFLKQCVEEGYFGYPHDNNVEYQISWGNVFMSHQKTLDLDYVFNKR